MKAGEGKRVGGEGGSNIAFDVYFRKGRGGGKSVLPEECNLIVCFGGGGGGGKQSATLQLGGKEKKKTGDEFYCI